MNTTFNASPSSPSSRSRNLISRLASPFSGKARHVTEFFIHLDDPHRTYTNGDSLKGSIQLVVQKPLRVTHITLSLHGFAKVYKNPTVPGEGIPSEVKIPSASRGKAGVQYHGNGLLSFFEDEQIVCGDGRLNPGRYSFVFEALFPRTSLPSSLDFERGTISYVLIATFTRPTTISPTFTCKEKVYFIEALDVARSKIPKPHTITLRPIVKRHKSKSHARRAVREELASSPHSADASRRPSDSDSHADHAADGTPASPSVSEFSNGSGPSSNISFQVAQGTSRATLSADEAPHSDHDKTITASVELLKGGVLPGDLIPLRILVHHTRQVTSMQGIIVTLYRKARVDSHPVIFDTAKEMLVDDVLISRPGLSGLSLSAPTSHMFRMDLAQSFAPMVVNPGTLEADIKTAVRAPEDLFPTVTCLPGDMITFTYHVEVVMDLAGKLVDHDRFPRMHMIGKPDFSLGSKPSSTGYGMHSGTETYHLIDTTEIRRDRSVAECTFDIIICSTDSHREAVAHKRPSNLGQDTTRYDDIEIDDDTIHYENMSTPQASALQSRPSQVANLPLFPPPEFEEPGDEKARLRLAEQRLLPSAPPEDGAEASSSQARPSAPTLNAIDEAYREAGQSNRYGDMGFPSDSFDVDDESVPAYQRHERGSSDGADDTDRTITASRNAATEDKQELERQRLLAMASSPDDNGSDDGQEAESSHERASLPVPTAPVLSDDD